LDAGDGGDGAGGAEEVDGAALNAAAEIVALFKGRDQSRDVGDHRFENFGCDFAAAEALGQRNNADGERGPHGLAIAAADAVDDA